MSDMNLTKNWGWTRILAKGKHFLIRHLTYYSYSQVRYRSCRDKSRKYRKVTTNF
jgi:hypothetical protein